MHNVTWKPAALDHLADIYVNTNPIRREEIARAIDALNRRLAQDPYDEGEPRSGNERITFIAHMVVQFRVLDHE